MIGFRKQFELKTRAGIRLRTPHSALRTPHARAGISLLEVLVSMFILTVGLLSIGSLLPLGSYQAQKALTEDAKATIGQNAYREFRTRGMANPDLWVTQGTPVIRANIGAPNNPIMNNGVAIDPWGLAAAANANPQINSNRFPRSTFTGPSLPRITLASLWPGDNNYAMYEELARNVFVARDDTIWEKSSNADGPAISRWEYDDPNTRGVVFRREFAGNYSWLVTMLPRFPHLIGSQGPLSNEWRISIVVFHRRNPKVQQREDGELTEQNVRVKNDDPLSDFAVWGQGGGDLIIDTVQDPGMIPGQWVLVSGWYIHNNQQVPNRGDPETSTNGVFLWYRVVTVDRSDDKDSSTKPRVTLAGPDWPYPVAICKPTHIGMFDGAVGVFEKTVSLEGPSLYAP